MSFIETENVAKGTIIHLSKTVIFRDHWYFLKTVVVAYNIDFLTFISHLCRLKSVRVKRLQDNYTGMETFIQGLMKIKIGGFLMTLLFLLLLVCQVRWLAYFISRLESVSYVYRFCSTFFSTRE